MSFAANIKALFDSATDLNNAVNGIYYQIIPDNSPLTEKNIVYTFGLVDGIDTLDKNNVFDWYDLRIVILAQDSLDIENIKELIREFFDNYSDNNFRDIKINNTNPDVEGEREQFLNELQYRILYQN